MRRFSLAVLAIVAVDAHAQTQLELRRMVGIELTGTVSSVGDGDTFDVKLDGSRQIIRIRLAGVDTPELAEPFGVEARNAARVLLFDKPVRLVGTAVDPFRRLVAKVTVGAVDAGIELLRAGLACHFTQYSSDQRLAQMQAEAKAAGRGFWAPGSARPSCAGPTGPPRGPFHGNRQSRVYHAPSCPNYNCKNCTAVFQDEAGARRGGYRPAGDCIH